MEPITPFRWDVARREQLGQLTQGVEVETFPGFEDALVTCCGRVLALGGECDYVFVGRSPECVFDFLSGALTETSWKDRLRLLPISYGDEGWWPKPPERVAFRANLAAAGLAPETVERRPRRVALVDAVHYGSTFGLIVELIREWAEDGSSRWRAVAPRLRIVGLSWREPTSPKTWRWHQHLDWVAWLPAGAVKNVSIPGELYQFFTGGPKIAEAFPPDRWRDESVATPLRDDEARRGLALALRLYDLGKSRDGRARLAAALARQPQMSSRPLRSLVLELRGTSRSRG